MKNLTKVIFRFLLTGLILLPLSCTRTIIEPISPEGNTKVFGKPVFAENLYYFPKEALKNIKSYQNNRLVISDLSGVVNANETVNAGGRIAAHEIVVGDYLVSEPAPNAPQGFFGKVKNVIKNGSDYIIETIDAAFEDVFKDVHFKYDYALPVSFTIPENKIFVKAKKDIKGTQIKIEANLSGKLDFIFNTQMELNAKDFEIEKASIVFSTTHNHNLKLKMGLGFGIEPEIRKIPLTEINFTRVAFVGPFPIVIFETMGLYAKISLTGKIQIEAEVIKKSTSFAGAVYEKGSGWRKVETPEKDESPTLGKPTSIDLEGEVKIGGYAGVKYNFYGKRLAELSGEIGVYGKFTGSCNGKQIQIVPKSGSEINLGFSLYLFSSKPWTQPFEIEIPLSEKEYPVILSEFDCTGEIIPIPNKTELLPVAISTTDPHITSFDQNRYSFMAVGEFNAIKSTSDNFEIQVRQSEIKAKSDNGTVSWNTGLAIRTGNGDVCIYPPNKIFVNKQEVAFANYNLSNGGSIIKDGNNLTVTNSNQDVIKVSLQGTNFDYNITLNENRKGRIKGLFGNYDGISSNDIQLQSGIIVKNNFQDLYPQYADSWRIKQSESLFVYDTGKNTDSYTDKTFPKNPINLTNSQRNTARSICEQAGITDPVLLENCTIDVASTNDNSLAKRIFDGQTSSQTLRNFSIGGFSTSDVQLDYYGASATNKEAILDTRAFGFSRVLMKQGVDIKKGFVTEFSFSTSELNPSSCFYLALWPTEVNSRNTFQDRVGFCFGFINNTFKVFYDLSSSPNSSNVISTKEISNFIDGKIHKVRIYESQVSNNQWKVELFLDDMNVPKLSATDSQSIANKIGSPNNVGYIEFQINQGSPSIVKLFNWSYKSF